MFGFTRETRSPSGAQTSRTTARLRGEALEERCVPTRYKWVNSVFDSTNNWTVNQNWEKYNGSSWVSTDTGEYPGAAGRTDDEAEFFVNSTTRDMQCVMNVPITLKNMKIQEAFSSYVELQDTLTITNELMMDAAGATLSGGSSQKQVRLTGTGATFKWWSGSLFTIQMIAGAGASVVLPEHDPTSSVLNPYLCMAGTSIDINEGGALDWKWRNVRAALAVGVSPGTSSANLVHIHPGGTFDVTAGGLSWGATDPTALVVSNRGSMIVHGPYRTKILGRLNNQDAGGILVTDGTLEVTGPVIQDGPGATFNVAGGASLYPHNTAGVLDIQAGLLTGGGTVEGSVCLYPGSELNPGGVGFPFPNRAPATFTITCILHMYGGTLGIDIQTPTQYDKVAVGGQAKLGGTLFARFVGGLLNTDFRPGDRIEFMTYDSRDGDFSAVVKPVGWGPDKTNKKYWLQQIGGVAGRVRNDADGDGVFEPANGETVLAGVPVELLDAEGAVVDTTTSAADGSYLFDELPLGDWKVRFTRPADLRPVPAGLGSDESLDSDYAYATLLAAVTLTEESPTVTNTADALFRPLTAVDDEYHTTSGATIGGDVSLNDPPAAGDTLTFALDPDHGPAAGILYFYDDGTFTYIAPSVPHGSPTLVVTFQYIVTDSYGHTATATVTIYVAPFWDDGSPGDPPPPP